ncbi:MAG: hypothetical protein MZW92_02290 [Comamonadaceae bacterium]|nr:hypothetical protein [Comamonadaceae bacterium]
MPQPADRRRGRHLALGPDAPEGRRHPPGPVEERPGPHGRVLGGLELRGRGLPPRQAPRAGHGPAHGRAPNSATSRGSCQYWIDDCMSLRDREEKRIKMPLDQGLRLEPGDLPPAALGQPHRQRGPALEPDPDHARLADGPHRPLPVLPDVGAVHQDPPLLGPSPRRPEAHERAAPGPRRQDQGPRLRHAIRAAVGDISLGRARSGPSSSGGTSSWQEIDRIIRANGEAKVLY